MEMPLSTCGNEDSLIVWNCIRLLKLLWEMFVGEKIRHWPSLVHARAPLTRATLGCNAYYGVCAMLED